MALMFKGFLLAALPLPPPLLAILAIFSMHSAAPGPSKTILGLAGALWALFLLAALLPPGLNSSSEVVCSVSDPSETWGLGAFFLPLGSGWGCSGKLGGGGCSGVQLTL